MECAAWARIRNRKTSWPLRSTRTLESYYRLCCWQATLAEATSFSRGLSTKYASVGYDFRASGRLDLHPSRGLWGIDDAESVRKSASRTGGRPTSRSPDRVLANRSYLVCQRSPMWWPHILVGIRPLGTCGLIPVRSNLQDCA